MKSMQMIESVQKEDNALTLVVSTCIDDNSSTTSGANTDLNCRSSIAFENSFIAFASFL